MDTRPQARRVLSLMWCALAIVALLAIPIVATVVWKRARVLDGSSLSSESVLVLREKIARDIFSIPTDIPYDIIGVSHQPDGVDAVLRVTLRTHSAVGARLAQQLAGDLQLGPGQTTPFRWSPPGQCSPPLFPRLPEPSSLWGVSLPR